MNVSEWFERLIALTKTHPSGAPFGRYLRETRSTLAEIERELHGTGTQRQVEEAAERSSAATNDLVRALRGSGKKPRRVRNSSVTAPISGPAKIGLPADLNGFADVVLGAARASKTGKFGSDKVFISHVAAQLRREGYRVEMPTFGARLVEAHRARLLALTRADLVDAMDPRDVDGSEIRWMNATFHFVRADRR